MSALDPNKVLALATEARDAREAEETSRAVWLAAQDAADAAEVALAQYINGQRSERTDGTIAGRLESAVNGRETSTPADLMKQFPDISRGSVYVNLGHLVKSGRIRRERYGLYAPNEKVSK